MVQALPAPFEFFLFRTANLRQVVNLLVGLGKDFDLLKGFHP
jgi:hypothetical protein